MQRANLRRTLAGAYLNVHPLLGKVEYVGQEYTIVSHKESRENEGG